jgi:hypothetical protein
MKFTLGIFLMLLAFAGCDNPVSPNNNGVPSTIGSMRFIHSAGSNNGIDFAIQRVGATNFELAQSEASYGNQYGYFNLATGTRLFRIYDNGTGISFGSVTVNIDQGSKYTLIATDLDNAVDTALISLSDTTAAPPQGTAFVRFVHASPDAGTLNVVSVDSSVFISNFSRRQTTAYLAIDAGTYPLRISSSNGQLLFNYSLTVFSGGAYCVVISGSRTGLFPTMLNARNYPETGF